MLSSIKKDKKYRVIVKKFEIKRLQAKVFSQDLLLKHRLNSIPNKKFSAGPEDGVIKKTSINLYCSLAAQNSTSLTSRNSSKTRVKNRCIETGRSRSILRFCKLSRIILREKASKGLIPGVSKASW